MKKHPILFLFPSIISHCEKRTDTNPLSFKVQAQALFSNGLPPEAPERKRSLGRKRLMYLSLGLKTVIQRKDIRL